LNPFALAGPSNEHWADASAAKANAPAAAIADNVTSFIAIPPNGASAKIALTIAQLPGSRQRDKAVPPSLGVASGRYASGSDGRNGALRR
jgi:hypothetical protein